MGLLRDHASAFVSAFVSKLACPSWWILWILVSLLSLPCPTPTISCNSCGAALELASFMSCRLPESEWLFANIGEWLSELTVKSGYHPHLGGGHLGYGVVLAAEPVTSKYLLSYSLRSQTSTISKVSSILTFCDYLLLKWFLQSLFKLQTSKALGEHWIDVFSENCLLVISIDLKRKGSDIY